MAQVIHVYSDPLVFENIPYTAQVCGRPAGNIWEGWIEFVSGDGTDVRRTPRETTQPHPQALQYWASGLSTTYLEGAFSRTLERALSETLEAALEPYFDAPAPTVPFEPAAPVAVLDPFSVGAKGETLLRRELGAARMAFTKHHSRLPPDGSRARSRNSV